MLPPALNCYSPQAFRNAYGISPLLKKGIDGRGRTVIIVGVARLRCAAREQRSSNQHLPGRRCVRQLFPPSPRQAHGGAGEDAQGLSGPGLGEEVEDVEMVHAVAPGRHPGRPDRSPLLLSGCSDRDLRDVVSASKGADVVSMSGGAWEDCFTSAQLAEGNSLISQLAGRHMTVTAALG